MLPEQNGGAIFARGMLGIGIIVYSKNMLAIIQPHMLIIHFYLSIIYYYL